MGIIYTQLRLATEFPLSPREFFADDDEKVMQIRAWCLNNIGVQNDQWCIIETAYGGCKQFRFKNLNDLILYKMVWE